MFLVDKYDVIVLFQVLEHIVLVKDFIDKIKLMLKNGGTLIVEVPNLDDHLISISKEYRDFFWQRAHISYFTPQILKNVLCESGYKDVSILGIQRYGLLNMQNWIVSGKPQIKAPSFKVAGELKWLEDYYKSSLCKRLKSDTLVATAMKAD